MQQNEAQTALRICGQAAALAADGSKATVEAQLQAFDNLGELQLVLGQNTQAESNYRRGLTLRERTYGKDSAEAAQSLEAVGNALMRGGKHADAKNFFDRSLAIRLQKYGVQSKEAANSMHSLGLIAMATHRPDEAEEYFRRALAIRDHRSQA